jgi:hypothetical protein
VLSGRECGTGSVRVEMVRESKHHSVYAWVGESAFKSLECVFAVEAAREFASTLHVATGEEAADSPVLGFEL